jgi:hypothetical protein
VKPKAYSYIRFSNPEQEKGDSARRQIERAEKYAKERGLELDNTLKLQDRGISAFRGLQRIKGALGAFLRLVDDGRIPRGSMLIVESLDRLSREHVLDALNQFTSIIKAGITVVTLQDKMEYSEESVRDNWAQLIVSIAAMATANEESRKKQDRLSKVWENKRQNINKRKLTRKCPDWLEPVVGQVDGREVVVDYKPIPGRPEVIEQIFRMKFNGKGPELIGKELNQSDSWKPKNGWRKSYINKILRNRAVLGEFQPHRTIHKDGKKKREPVGEPIPNYYPAVVKEELFYQVQKQLAENDYKGGRTGRVTNLFTHFIKCGYCESSMVIENKGSGPKGGIRLVCDYANRRLGCERLSLPYQQVEKSVLMHVRGLNAEDLFPDKEQQQSELSKLQERLAAVKGNLERTRAKIINLTDSIEDTGDSRVKDTLQVRLSERHDERERLEADETALERSIDELSRANNTAKQRLEDIDDLFLALEHSNESNRFEVRLRLREQLKQILERVNIYPNQVQEVELIYKSGRSVFPEIDQLMRYMMNIRMRVKLLKS